MKRKFFKLSALLLGLCASVGFFGNKDIETAKATKGAGDEKWGLVGSFAASNWTDNKDIPFTYNNKVSPARYELEYTLNAGDQFKMRIGGKWGNGEIGYGGNTGGGISTYLTNSGGNFKVKSTGTYLLMIKDDNVTGYGDKSYGFSIEAVGEVVDPEQPEVGTEVWGLIGSFSGSGWTNDFDFTYNKETARYEVLITLAANDEFKVRYNHAWGTEIGYGAKNDGSVATYLTSNGTNFKVKTAGTYIIALKDVEGSTSTPRDKIFSIEPATVGKHTVTYYNGTTVVDTVEVAEDGNAYNAKFVYQKGYRLEGWYTDSALTKPYTSTEIKADLSLYGKYVAAENYGLYVKNTLKWSKVNAYLWNTSFDHNNTWPGVAMTAVEGTDYYYIEIDGANGYNHIIFNDGTAQTSDLELAGKTVCYVINADKTATAAEVRKVIAYVPGDVYAYEELGYTGATATGTGFATISFDKGAVTVKENDASITASEKEAALIERIAKVDTCNEYSKHAIYRNLVTVSGIEGALSLTITDKGGEVTIGDKLDFMEKLDASKAKGAAATTSTHTILAGQSSSLWFVIMIGVLGLGSVLGYYFLSKKRFSK